MRQRTPRLYKQPFELGRARKLEIVKSNDDSFYGQKSKLRNSSLEKTSVYYSHPNLCLRLKTTKAVWME